MAVDYDLVIIGGTGAAAIAAQQAAQYGARVAWVLQGEGGDPRTEALRGFLWSSRPPVPRQGTSPGPQATPLERWATARQWALQGAALPTDRDPKVLAAAGVDVIPAQGRLLGDAPLRVAAGDRDLTTRRLLLALGGVPGRPAIPGLDTVPVLTPLDILAQDHCPPQVVLLGAGPEGAALASALLTWGAAVTLISPHGSLLPGEDPAVSQWFTTYLQVAGATLYLGTAPTKIRPQGTGVQVDLPQGQVRAAALVLATPPQVDWSQVGLESVGLTPTPQGLQVNGYLQTSHPQIYGCGDGLGGYPLPALAAQEARLAVTNAVFWRRHPLDYRQIPYGLGTWPEVGRLGLTEPQAHRRYRQIQVYQGPWDQALGSHWRGETLGFLKVVADRRGQVLGVHGVGAEATLLVEALGLGAPSPITLQDLGQLSTDITSPLGLLSDIVTPWQQHRWRLGGWRRDWAENWCHWQRSR